MNLFRGNIPSSKGLALCVLALVMVTFVVKSMLPAGFMPSTAADGSYEIVICSGSGMKTITVPAEDGHGADDAGSDRCTYQILSSTTSVEPVTPVYIMAPLTPALVPDITPDVATFAFLTFHKGSRAPPSFV